jgi:hypothetical protein
MTPADSVLAMTVPLPVKSMLMALAPDVPVLTTRVTVVECVNEPLDPVIVSVDVPAGVALVVLTVSVEVPTPVIAAGLNDAVAPPGNPVALRLTASLKPLSAPVVTVQTAAAPGATVCEAGAAVIEKSGEDATTSVVVAPWLRAPLVPVIVSVEVPAGVAPVVLTVSVDVPAPVTDAGLNEAVAPAGRPLAARFTVPEKPLDAPIVTE